MCEVFPYFPLYCFFIPLRIGLIFIAIQSIMTGVAGLTGLQLTTDIDYYKLKNITEDLILTDPKQLLSRANLLIICGFTLISLIFLVMGLVLLFSTIWHDEGLIQAFVWVTFLNVLFGFFVTTALGVDCIIEKSCLLSSMDWLSASFLIIVAILYFTLWMYYVCVVHSYLQDKEAE